jgi:hypothetical protein
MRLPRMTTWRWMVAVAVVGLLMGAAIGGVRLKQRRDLFLALGTNHAQQEAHYGREMLIRVEPDTHLVVQEYVCPGHVDYHARLARKYERAARYPWLPVEPDPPEPE